MRSFAEEIAVRAATGADLLAEAPGDRLGLAELTGLGLNPDLGPDLRVALCFHRPLQLIRALAALDGQVAALLLVSHAQPAEAVRGLAAAAGASLILSDRADLAAGGAAGAGGAAEVAPLGHALGLLRRVEPVATDWLMTTSGTTGRPKIVAHRLSSLARTVQPAATAGARPPAWGLVYDPTRFAGMQVTLQALLGGGRLVAADTSAALADQVAALAAAGVTHLSATPTLWRRLLMVPGIGALALRQVTLGGEIADQATLAALRAAFPAARIVHIYASTEAGVGFSVRDERAGFPAAWIGAATDAPGGDAAGGDAAGAEAAGAEAAGAGGAPAGVAMKLVDDILWLRPPEGARPRPGPGIETDAEGFINSGDRIGVEDGRALFLGRASGMINVGGVKVYPEAVERVILTVPGVALAQVSGRRNPMTGALVLARVQPEPGADPEALRPAILAACRAALEREAVPAVITFVEDFSVNAAGKLVRTKGTAG